MENKRGAIHLIAGLLVAVALSMFLLANYGPDTISGATITGGVVGVGEDTSTTGNNLAILTETFAISKAFKYSDVYPHYTLREIAELSMNDNIKKFFLIQISSEGLEPGMYLSDVSKSDDATKIVVKAVGITDLSFKNE